MSILKEAKRYIRITKMFVSSEKQLMLVAEKAFKDVIESRNKNKGSGTFLYMKGFKMKSPSIMTIEYQYGGGDMEFDSSFDYDITTNTAV